jgi:2-polyprenyl-3-methyl-5-hydroxy-6-metoxy-1,4-benzoquinol methylase
VAEPAYDAIAAWYDSAVRAGSLLHELVLPAVWGMLGAVHGLRICDLACGQGVLARQLAARGAAVVGVDLSSNLLGIAQQNEATTPLGIRFLLDDAQTLNLLADAAFDGVVCNMALMDIPDLEATCRAVRRVLCPEGWWVFSITHPCFQTPDSGWTEDPAGTMSRSVRAYFAEGAWRPDNAEGVRGRVGTYHRTLTSYINALTGAGLVIERLSEPRETGDLAARVPAYVLEVPAVLVARCRRAF